MEKIKLGLKNIQGILSRSELKAIQGGSGGGCNGCEGKKDGAACNRPDNCRVGKCRYGGTGGLYCSVT